MSYPLPLPIVYGGILRLVLLIGAVSALSGCKRQAQELNLQTIAARQELGSLREELQRLVQDLLYIRKRNLLRLKIMIFLDM